MVNIYNYYTDHKIWPRGLPLHFINKTNRTNNIETGNYNIGVWQGLADEDPDVDAIYRLTSDVVCNFKERPPLVLQPGTFTPFNTQNTANIKELFPLMYLPTYVNFRFTDICFVTCSCKSIIVYFISINRYNFKMASKLVVNISSLITNRA